MPDVNFTDDVEQMISDITEQVSRLHSLVENILDLSKVEHGSMPITRTEFQLEDAVSDIVRFIQPQYAGKISVNIDKAVPNTVNFDKEKVSVILHNLIHNATKFTDIKTGIININIQKRVHKEREQLLIEVKDNGPGIAKKDMSKLFKRFSKLTDKMGSGLGLTIAKKLLWLMGGNIKVSSTEGKGTSFEVSLPLVRPTPILHIVSPDNDTISTIKGLLKNEPIECHSSRFGSQAFLKAEVIHPDLIILDEVQVDSTFFKLFEKFKNEAGLDTVPIILLRHDSETFTSLSGTPTLLLPIEEDRLKEILSDYLIIAPNNKERS